MIISFVILSKFMIADRSLPFHETLKASLTNSTSVSRNYQIYFNLERFTANMLHSHIISRIILRVGIMFLYFSLILFYHKTVNKGT